MILLASAIILGIAIYAYGKGSRWVPFFLLFPYLAVSVYLAARLILPGTEVGFWALLILGTGLPMFILAVMMADMRWGLFALDTFFGIVFVAFLVPVMLIGNTVAALIWALKA